MTLCVIISHVHLIFPNAAVVGSEPIDQELVRRGRHRFLRARLIGLDYKVREPIGVGVASACSVTLKNETPVE